MHFHLTSAQLLVGAFTLTLGIIFVLAAVVQFRLQRARPFRDYYCSELDRNLFPEEPFIDEEGIRPKQHNHFQAVDPAHLATPNLQLARSATQPESDRK